LNKYWLERIPPKYWLEIYHQNTGWKTTKLVVGKNYQNTDWNMPIWKYWLENIPPKYWLENIPQN
jgi:hypothetical protein